MISTLRRWLGAGFSGCALASLAGLAVLTGLTTACAAPAPQAASAAAEGAFAHPMHPVADSAASRQADAHLQLALAYYRQAQWQVALDEATLALRAEPQSADGYSMRGLILMASGRGAQAGDDFRQALALAPDQPDYLNNYGWFLCRNGAPHASLAWFERAAAQPAYASPAKALRNAGTCSEMAGQPAAAKAYFMQAAAQVPGYQRGVLNE